MLLDGLNPAYISNIAVLTLPKPYLDCKLDFGQIILNSSSRVLSAQDAPFSI